MNTDFTLTIACTADSSEIVESLLRSLHTKLNLFEQNWSEFLSSSWVSQFNAADVGASFKLDPVSSRLMSRSLFLRHLADSAFDPLFRTPEAILRKGTEGALSWNPDTHLLIKNHPAAHLGFGAIGKGFALDLLRKEIESRGYENFCLSAGGSSIILSGFAHPMGSTRSDHDEPSERNAQNSQGWSAPWEALWKVNADTDERSIGFLLPHTSGRPVALGISGLQAQRHHLLAQEGVDVLSALVISHSAATADALSTALFRCGPSALAKIAEQSPEWLGFAALDSRGLRTSPEFDRIFPHLWGETHRTLENPNGSERTLEAHGIR